jgi:transcriptional regulator with XRE-family HTH domain
MEHLSKLIGQRIKTLRNGLKISQENLAFKADIDRTYMTDIENGKRNISVNILDKLVAALETNLSDFFNDKCFQDGR